MCITSVIPTENIQKWTEKPVESSVEGSELRAKSDTLFVLLPVGKHTSLIEKKLCHSLVSVLLFFKNKSFKDVFLFKSV